MGAERDITGAEIRENGDTGGAVGKKVSELKIPFGAADSLMGQSTHHTPTCIRGFTHKYT